MSHSPLSIFLPLLAQVLITVWAYVLLSVRKSRAAASGQVNEARRALHDDAWPDSVLQVNNNIRNQFELPVLFYVLVLVLWAEGNTGLFVQTVAWLFVASRAVHIAIHTGINVVPLRRRVFTFGFFMIVVLLVTALVSVFRG